MQLDKLDRLDIEYLFAQFYNVVSSEKNASYQDMLNKQIETRLEKFLEHPQVVFQQFSLVSWTLIRAMDVAFKPSLSAEEQLESVSEHRVFKTHLVELVNSAAFQPSTGPKTHIGDPKHAILYLGNGAMKLIIPYFMLKKQASEEIGSLKRTTLKFWKQTLTSAIYTSELCELRQHEEYSEAFATSVMIGLCKFIIGKAYADLFESVKKAYIDKARKTFKVKLLDGVTECEIDSDSLCTVVEKHWLNFAISVTKKLEFEHLKLHDNLLAIQNPNQHNKPFIDTFKMAFLYNMMSNLKKNRYITKEDEEALIQDAKIDPDEFKQLRKLKLTLRRLFNKEKEGTKITDMIATEKEKNDRAIQFKKPGRLY